MLRDTHVWKTREVFNSIVLIEDLRQMKKMYTSGQWNMPKEEGKKELKVNNAHLSLFLVCLGMVTFHTGEDRCEIVAEITTLLWLSNSWVGTGNLKTELHKPWYMPKVAHRRRLCSVPARKEPRAAAGMVAFKSSFSRSAFPPLHAWPGSPEHTTRGLSAGT